MKGLMLFCQGSLSNEADFLTEIFEESIVLIVHERAGVVLTRKYVNRGRLFGRDIRRKRCPDLS